MCVCVGGGGYNFVYFFYVPLFLQDFSLKPCQFSLSYYVFFSSCIQFLAMLLMIMNDLQQYLLSKGISVKS